MEKGAEPVQGADRPRSWEIWIDGSLRAFVDGVALPAAPTKAVGVLFLALAHAAPESLSRNEIGRRLYPGQEGPARGNAVRQSLHRLREWLGPGRVEVDREGARLAGEAFNFRRCRGNSVERALFADLDHPWIEEFRRLHRGADEADGASGTTARWIELIRDMAAHDLDEARGVLVGGRNALAGLGLGPAIELFTLTAPRRPGDAYGWEHALLRGLRHAESAQFDKALDWLGRSFRIAKAGGNPVQMERSLLEHSYAMLEAGHVGAIGRRLQRLRGTVCAAHRLELANLEACHLWNTWDVGEAARAFRRASGAVEGGSEADQAHFWCNYAYFAAESGLCSEFEEAFEACEGLLRARAERRMRHVLDAAEMLHTARVGLHHEALRRIGESIASGFVQANPALRLYLEVAAAQIESEIGDSWKARRRWREVERERAQHGAQPTPRLRSIQAAAFAG